jgi:hypothetical protein
LSSIQKSLIDQIETKSPAPGSVSFIRAKQHLQPSLGNTYLPQHPPLPSPSSVLPSKCSRLRPLELRIWALCGGCQTNGPLVPRAKNATDVVVPIFRAAGTPLLRADRQSGLGLLNRGSESLSSLRTGFRYAAYILLFTSVLHAYGCYGDLRTALSIQTVFCSHREQVRERSLEMLV